MFGLKTKRGVIFDDLPSNDLVQSSLSAINKKFNSYYTKGEVDTAMSSTMSAIQDNTYDDTSIQNVISSINSSVITLDNSLSSISSSVASGNSIDKAILNIEIPSDQDNLNLHANIILSKNSNFTNPITLSTDNNYDIMQISLDDTFIQLTQQQHDITLSYYTGTLVVVLTSQNTSGFDPSSPWYVKVQWSNGVTSTYAQQIYFQYIGYIRLITENVQTTI